MQKAVLEVSKTARCRRPRDVFETDGRFETESTIFCIRTEADNSKITVYF